MIPAQLPLDKFLETEGVIIDVRTPAEFLQGRIPGAVNLPLFSNEERVIVGTAYKQQGQFPATELGIGLVGPRMVDMVKQARELVGDAPLAKVHCWRGGMRSQAVATLLQSCGIRAVTLQGGYKTFRRWCLDVLDRPKEVAIVGGMTGSGKTRILEELKLQGEQVVDLEALAVHRGSAYGQVPEQEQPSTEQFENSIAWEWAQVDGERTVWIEDESRLIGKCKLPEGLFSQMQKAPLYIVERPRSERMSILEQDYKELNREYLLESTQRIEKRLGGEITKRIRELIEAGDYEPAGHLALDYYDKAYRHSLARRTQEIRVIESEGLSDSDWARILMERHSAVSV